MTRRCAQFTQFYMNRHTGRKLTWLHEWSNGELATSCFGKQYNFRVGVHRLAMTLTVAYYRRKASRPTPSRRPRPKSKNKVAPMAAKRYASCRRYFRMLLSVLAGEYTIPTTTAIHSVPIYWQQWLCLLWFYKIILLRM